MLVTVWLACSYDSINGTDKSRDEFLVAILDNWLLKQASKKGHSARLKRGPTAMRKMWAKVLAGVMELTHYYLLVKGKDDCKLTGNMKEDPLIDAALSACAGANVYARVRGDQAEDEISGKQTKRRNKTPKVIYTEAFKMLYKRPKFNASATAFHAEQKKQQAAAAKVKATREANKAAAAAGGAITAAAAAGAADGGASTDGAVGSAAADDAEGDSSASGSKDGDFDSNEDKSAWEARPIGNKAAKAARSQEFSDGRTLANMATSIQRLGDAAAERNQMMSMSQAFMMASPAGKLYWEAQAAKILASAGLKLPEAANAAPTVPPLMEGAAEVATGGAAGAGTLPVPAGVGEDAPAGVQASGGHTPVGSASAKVTRAASPLPSVPPTAQLLLTTNMDVTEAQQELSAPTSVARLPAGPLPPTRRTSARLGKGAKSGRVAKPPAARAPVGRCGYAAKERSAAASLKKALATTSDLDGVVGQPPETQALEPTVAAIPGAPIERRSALVAEHDWPPMWARATSAPSWVTTADAALIQMPSQTEGDGESSDAARDTMKILEDALEGNDDDQWGERCLLLSSFFSLIVAGCSCLLLYAVSLLLLCFFFSLCLSAAAFDVRAIRQTKSVCSK